MDFSSFEALAGAMWSRIPAVFKVGVQSLVVHEPPKPDPLNPGVFLMGECAVDEVVALIPDAALRTTIHLYHGSFVELARQEDDFPWDEELWETLTHELRHHLEWRAGVDYLGDEDDLQLENLARINGRPFALDYHRRGPRLDEGVYTVDGELFIEAPIPHKEWPSLARHTLDIEWQGIRCVVHPVPTADLRAGIVYALPDIDLDDDDAELPWRDVVIVLRKKGRWFG